MEGLLLRDAQAVCRCNCLGSKLAPFFQMIKVIAAIFRARVPCSMSNCTACPGLTSVLVEKQNLSGLLVSVAGGVEKIVCCDIRNHKGRPRGMSRTHCPVSGSLLRAKKYPTPSTTPEIFSSPGYGYRGGGGGAASAVSCASTFSSPSTQSKSASATQYGR